MLLLFTRSSSLTSVFDLTLGIIVLRQTVSHLLLDSLCDRGQRLIRPHFARRYSLFLAVTLPSPMPLNGSGQVADISTNVHASLIRIILLVSSGALDQQVIPLSRTSFLAS